MAGMDVTTKCRGLRQFWEPRNKKMKEWYKLIQMVDELKTSNMESFVGNDPRSMYNLVLHLLDVEVPHKVPIDEIDASLLPETMQIEKLCTAGWKDNSFRFRRTGRQSLFRHILSLMLATGWYSVFSIVADDGSRTFIDVWHPAQVYPMWGEDGQEQCAHITTVTAAQAKRMIARNGWNLDYRRVTHDLPLYDYWWRDDYFNIWNGIVLGSDKVKEEQTRFTSIPIFTAPVGGLPDTGIISESKDDWKKDIGQSILATNENIYRSWNRWWSFSLQLLRDTAQPRFFERSASGQHIVKPEDVFKRGAVFRGGPQDDVKYLTPPPIPLEIRSAQLDLEAMMQRGGVSWSMYGSATAGMTAYVMSQLASSASQILKPFHQSAINLVTDIDNSWVDDARRTGAKPYGFGVPSDIPDFVRVSADYEVKIPGDLIQRATTARMLNSDFELSYLRVMQELFPEVKNPLEEKARLKSEKAERHPVTAVIALVEYLKKMAEILRRANDPEGARLYEKAAMQAEASMQLEVEGAGGTVPVRTEARPPSLTAPPATY